MAWGAAKWCYIGSSLASWLLHTWGAGFLWDSIQKTEGTKPASSLRRVAETQGQATETRSKTAVLREGELSPPTVNIGGALRESCHCGMQMTVKTLGLLEPSAPSVTKCKIVTYR